MRSPACAPLFQLLWPSAYLFSLRRAALGNVQLSAAVHGQVDIHAVPDFNTMYELYDPCTIMFFFRNKVRVPLPFPPCSIPGRCKQ